MSIASDAQLGNAPPDESPPGAEVVASSVGNSITVAEAEAEAAVDVANDASPPPTYAPEDDEEEEISIEDVYNPHNLTMDELEKFLYEWEEEAAPYVTEYFDERTMHKLRTGETDDKAEEEDNTVAEEAAAESESNGWMDRLRSKMTYDDGSKTRVEFKKGATKYLTLSDDAAHVVEFYAPWYDSIIVYLRYQMQFMHADLCTRVVLICIGVLTANTTNGNMSRLQPKFYDERFLQVGPLHWLEDTIRYSDFPHLHQPCTFSSHLLLHSSKIPCSLM